MAEYWPTCFCVCLLTEMKSRSINTQKKNETWTIEDLLYGIKHQKMIFELAGPTRNPERAVRLHLARSGSQSQRGIWFVLPAHGASHTAVSRKVVQRSIKAYATMPEGIMVNCQFESTKT